MQDLLFCKRPNPDNPLQFLQRLQRMAGRQFRHLHHGHRHVLAALVDHVFDVDSLFRRGSGDVGNHVRDILMQHQHADSVRLAQLHFRIVYAVMDAAVLQVIPDFRSRHAGAVLFALRRAGTQVRNADHIVRTDDIIVREVGHIASDFAAFQGRQHISCVHQFAAGEVQDAGAVLHLCELLSIDGTTGRIIQRNMERDREVDAELHGLGWSVLRFWSKDVLRKTEDCIGAIEEAMFVCKTNDY